MKLRHSNLLFVTNFKYVIINSLRKRNTEIGELKAVWNKYLRVLSVVTWGCACAKGHYVTIWENVEERVRLSFDICVSMELVICCFVSIDSVEQDQLRCFAINAIHALYDLYLLTHRQMQLKYFTRVIPTESHKSFTYLWHIRINISCLARDAFSNGNEEIQ